MKTSRFLATIPRRLSCISKNKLWNQRFFVTSIKVIPFVRRVRCYPIRIVDLPFRTIWRTKDSIEYFFFFFLSFSNVEKTKMKSSHRCNMFSPSACNRFAFKVDKLETIPRLGPNFNHHFCELHDRCFFFAHNSNFIWSNIFHGRHGVSCSSNSFSIFFFLEIIPLLYEDSTVMMTWWLRGEKDWKTRCSSFFMYFIRNKSLHAFSFFFLFFSPPSPCL